MLIDWVTVIAQLLNFVILVWLLKRYLYLPILRAIDEREARIAAEIEAAEKMKAEARAEIDEFRQKNREFERRRAALLDQAAGEAEAERLRLLDESRREAEALRSRLLESLKNEAQQLHQEIRRRTRQEVFAITRQTLADLAGTDLEERIVDLFVQRLRSLNQEAKGRLASALSAPFGPGVVRTAFALPQEHRDAIKEAIQEITDEKTAVRFETAPDLISGIELVSNGQKMAWSIEDYLATLEQGIHETLNLYDKPGSGPEAEAATIERSR